MRTRRASLFLLTAVLALFSCASDGFDGSGSLVGRVCDAEGNPVPGYRLSFGIGKSVVSGVNGMFCVHGVESGRLSMKGFGAGWKSVDEEVDFFDRKSVLVVQVESESDVYRRVEEAIRAGDLDGSESLMKEVEKGCGVSDLYRFYTDLIEYKRRVAAGDAPAADEMKRSLSAHAGMAGECGE
nr:hypothetical protein [Treponema sp.]